MGKESGFSGRLYSLSGNGDSSSRGRASLNAVGVAGTSESQLLGDNTLRIWALLVNNDTANDVWLALGNDPAISGQGIPLLHAGGWCLINKEMPWTGSIRAIADSAPVSVYVCEVSLQTTTAEPGPGPGPGPGPITKFGIC
jgi:hypothetical protein